MIRILLINCLLIFTVTGLHAQLSGNNAVPFGAGWQLSLTVSPEIIREGSFSVFVTEADTITRTPGAFQPSISRPRKPDTLIRGNDLIGIYYAERALGGKMTLAESQVIARYAISAHRRWRSGFELSVGFNYMGYSETKLIDDVSGLPQTAFYYTSDIKRRRFGAVTSGAYHFLQNRRFQPYAGIQLFTNLNVVESQNQRLVD